ncbi:receptor activity-modifying protein 3-like isoform X2 [Triplophysa dalaica]|uniref:receptor activity-modifying protein 3-like isoform X2 n=1 Tax=Triplophysa dalaica TaxID=1582913 RepID=UPI0024DF4302|nr:receptor activity-modifying protein 3-like isoform X2 [Triplophysa dalaica]
MDLNLHTLMKVLLLGIFASLPVMRGLSATDVVDLSLTQQHHHECNRSLLLLEMETCGARFTSHMDHHVQPQDRCNLTHFIGEYHIFSYCTEINSDRIGCFWPNPVVEHFIIHIHKHFFSNCTAENAIHEDPPDDTLALLILVPVFLTLAMVVLVVWCSKRSDILA